MMKFMRLREKEKKEQIERALEYAIPLGLRGSM